MTTAIRPETQQNSNALLDDVLTQQVRDHRNGILDATLEETMRQNRERVQVEVKEFTQACWDAKASTTLLRMVPNPNAQEMTPPIDRMAILAQTGGQGVLPATLTDTAHDQLAEKIGLPKDYYRRMLNGSLDDRNLLATNVNHWFSTEPQRRLYRFINPITDSEKQTLAALDVKARLRGFLSDTYRTIDNMAILNRLLTPDETGVVLLDQLGLRVREYNLTEKYFFIKLVGVDRSLEELRLQHGIQRGDNAHVSGWVNELLRLGVAIRNSEIGFSSVAVEPFAEFLRCLNGLIVAEKLRVRHVGRRTGGEDESWSTEVQRLDDALVVLKVRDRIVQAAGEAAQKKAVKQIAAAANEVVKLPEDVPVFEFVGNIGKHYDLTEREIDALKNEVAEERATSPWGSDLTRFAVAQGFTALARTATPERRDELQRNGWAVLEDTTTTLLRAGLARTKN
jgi:hypothetical protein